MISPHGTNAFSRRAEQEADYLQRLGVDEILDARDLSGARSALDKERWASAIDSVGTRTLANVLSQIKYGCTRPSAGPRLARYRNAIHPTILRDVALAGVNSVLTPRKKRERAWSRLAKDLDLAKLSSMTSRTRLEDVPVLAAEILVGKIRGRIVVDL